MEEDSEEDLSEIPQEESTKKPASKSPEKSSKRLPAHEAATNELYRHEVLALLSCFLFPLAGAYLLHTIRYQLSRPSEGLVSNYNLTIFLLASELRPMAHLVKLIQSRTLHLQRVVNSNPYNDLNGKTNNDTKDLFRRLEELEAQNAKADTKSDDGTTDLALNGKQSALLTTEVRRTLQPDLDALNRAVRRYEKRATLQAFQTESRLLDLEARLNDAISLAAAAANNSQRQRGFQVIFDWIAAAIVFPLQAFGAMLSFPFRSMISLFYAIKTKVIGRPAPSKAKNIPVRRSSNSERINRESRSLGKLGKR